MMTFYKILLSLLFTVLYLWVLGQDSIATFRNKNGQNKSFISIREGIGFENSFYEELGVAKSKYFISDPFKTGHYLSRNYYSYYSSLEFMPTFDFTSNKSTI